MTKEITQEFVMQWLLNSYPNIQRGRWRKRVIAELCGADADPDEADNLRESIMGLRYEPDAFVIEKELKELLFFEVEVYSVLKEKKLQAYAAFMMQLAVRADVIVPCWGNTGKVPPRLRGRFEFLAGMLTGADKPLHCFGRTKGGDPLHPLMLGYSTPLVEFGAPKAPCRASCGGAV